MRNNVDWFKLQTGEKLEEIKHSYQEDFPGYITADLSSKYDPILLGRSVEDGRPFYASLEQFRKSMQVKAPAQKGKSTTVIGLAQELIRRNAPVVFFDETYKGESAYKLLHFCQQNKVKHLLIDLNLQKNPVFDFFHRDKNKEKYKSIAYLTDAFKVLFSVKDLADTPQIAQYLEAVLHVVYNAGLTLAEVMYFTVFKYEKQREWILEQCELGEKEYGYDPIHRYLIESVKKERRMFARFLSTMARLFTLNHPALQALCGDKPTVSFKRLIKEKYVIIVVLAVGDFNELQRRLYGTLVINEFLYHHDKQDYWMFIDEAQDYATTKLGDILDKRAKSGLHLGLLHHHMDQFEDPKLRTSVKLNTPIKFEFEKQREAWVTLNEMDPVYLRMPEVPTELGTAKDSPFNRKRSDILKNIHLRIPYDIQENSASIESGTTPDGATISESNSEPRGGRLWDDLLNRNEEPGTVDGSQTGVNVPDQKAP